MLHDPVFPTVAVLCTTLPKFRNLTTQTPIIHAIFRPSQHGLNRRVFTNDHAIF